MEAIDGANIQYSPGRVLECRAVVGKDLTAFNFLDYFDENTARERAIECAQEMTGRVLGWRAEEVEGALQLPDVDKVYDFIVGRLGMQPYGKLVYLEDDPLADYSGVTTNHNRTSVVLRSRILQDFPDEITPKDANFLNTLRVGGVAAHELAHLAGMQDKVYFTLTPQNFRPLDTIMAGTTVEAGGGTNQKGTYIEEGLGSLVQAMYTGGVLGIGKSYDPRGITPHRSPKGTVLHLPDRMNMLGHQEFVFCGWGMERLVEADEEIWDILMASRQYGVNASAIRSGLKNRMERISPRLFDRIDNTNTESLDDNMETTDRIDHAVTHFLR
jgi:hypothetical protein